MTSISAVPAPLPDRRLSAQLIAATCIAIVALAVTADGGPLTPIKAIVLGAVEGITEYLPISSTGHLLVTQRLLGLGTGPGKAAADTYAIAIQGGAILAVVALYRHRISQLANGVIGRDDAGRQLLTRLIVAFVPAAAIGVAFGDNIKVHLFGPWPIVAAWAVGGLVLLWWRPRHGNRARPRQGRRHLAQRLRMANPAPWHARCFPHRHGLSAMARRLSPHPTPHHLWLVPAPRGRHHRRADTRWRCLSDSADRGLPSVEPSPPMR